MKFSPQSKQTFNSLELDDEYLDTDDCLPNTLNSLDKNFDQGATKNIFRTKEIISLQSFEENLSNSIENSHPVSQQPFFTNEVTMKFIDHLSQNPKKESRKTMEDIIPKINLLPIQDNSTQISGKQTGKFVINKVFYSFQEESPRKQEQNKKSDINPKISSKWLSHKYKNLVFNQKSPNEVFYNHLLMTYKGLMYAKYCLAPQSFPSKKNCVKLIPLQKKPKTLFFDLDNTLISKSYKGASTELSLILFNENNQPFQMFFNLRPYCRSCLAILAEYYEIYIFTSATKDYADKIMEILDPNRKIFSGALSRNHCLRTKKGFYIKDLRIIINKYLTDMLIIDNLCQSFAFQIDNGVPILPWENDPNDEELKYLTKYLISISDAKDLRLANKQFFNLSSLMENKIEDLMF